MATQLNNLGAWIWQINQCDNGNFQQTINRLQAIGVKWVGIKMGDSNPYSFFTQSKVQELKQICNDAGMNLCGWNYSLPTTTDQQVSTIATLLDYGVEGWIIDAETEWEFQTNNNQFAEQFLSKLRATIGPEIALAHAPFAMIDYHINFPYTVFGKYCNYAMPQCYSSQFNWTMEYSTALMDQMWNKYFSLHPEIPKTSYCPIMASYGNEYPGVKGPLTANDIEVFYNKYRSQVNFSFYSVDAANSLFWETAKSIYSSSQNVVLPSPSIAIIPPIVQPVQDPSAPVPNPVPTPAPVAPPPVIAPNPPVNVVPTWLTNLITFISNIITQYLPKLKNK